LRKEKEMKLAEALIRVKELKTRINDLNRQILSSYWSYEDEPPMYEVTELRKERADRMLDLRTLKKQIALTNLSVLVDFKDQPISIQELIWLISDMKGAVGLQTQLATAPTKPVRNRYLQEEPDERKILVYVNCKDEDQKRQELQKDISDADALLQKTNWEVELNE